MIKSLYQKIKVLYHSTITPDPYVPQTRLLVREWLAIAVICGGMLGLVLASRIPNHTLEYLKFIYNDTEQPMLDVCINGCVERPGCYQMPQDAKVKDLIDEAGLGIEGSIEKKNIEGKLRQGQSVHVSKNRKNLKINASPIVHK